MRSAILIILFFTIFLIPTRYAKAQNCQLPVSIDCGVLTANSGLCSASVFCIGDSVGISNNGSTGPIDSSYICWGDGTINWFTGVFTGCKKHRYNFPQDSCIAGGNGSIGISIVFGVKHNCSPGPFSLSWILTPITIKFKPKARFTLTPNPGCVYQPITINNTSCPNSNTATFLWNFGDGSAPSTSQNPPPHIYTNAGNYTVTLSITNSCATSTYSQTVNILPPTIVSPVVTLPNICSPVNFTPDVNSQNATSFFWSFTTGNGTISLPPDSQPLFTLPNAGSYGIHLAVTGCCLGPIARCTWDTTLTVFTGPTTSVSHIPDFCGSASINPVNNFIVSGGTVSAYQWTFTGGSPSSSTLASPGTVTYSGPGNYIVKLVLTTPCGPITLADTFSVLRPTTVHPIVTLPTSCSPVTFIPDVNSQNATGFNWSVTGGSNQIIAPTDSQPSIALNAGGIFAIHLQAQGCCNAPTSDCVWDTTLTILQGPSIAHTPVPDFCGSASFTPSTYISSSGSITSYSWSFTGGAPATSNAANPGTITYSSPGTFIIRLTISGSCGSSTVSDTFVVRPPTVVAPILNIPSSCSPLSFIPSVHSHNATGFLWSTLMGSAIISQPTDSQPNFSVTNAGVLTIQVEASGCCTAPQSHCIWDTTVTLINGPAININSIPLFCSTAIVNPSNYFSTSGGISTYSWAFPGGSPSSSTSASPGAINYSSPGVFPITLTLNGPCGTMTKSDTVYIGAPPVISVQPSSLFGCDSLTISFTNSSPANQTYSWTPIGGSFVTGSATNSIAPSVFFNSPGSYAVSVEAFSAGCPSITNTFPVNVGEAPHLTRIAPTPDECDTIYFIFSNYFLLSPAISDSGYNWSILFNNNNIFSNSTTNPPPFQIGANGTYVVRASVWNACDTILLTDTFTISPPPHLTVPSDTSICKGSPSLILSANPSGGNWSWNGISVGNSFNPNLTSVVDNYLHYSYGANTCAVQDSFRVQVFGANINAGPDTAVCKNSGLLFFTGNPVGGYWNGQDIIDTISGSYNAASNITGSDTLTYILVEPALGCLIRDYLIVTVHSPNIGSINIPDSACINQQLTFLNNAAGTSAIWNFGDNSALSYSDSVLHSYSVANNYTITLYVINQFGCRDTVTKSLEVAQPPNAIFMLDTIRGCSILSVLITDLSNFYSPTTYTWDYGDGRRDTLYQPGTILFNQGPGDSTIYHIHLTASNSCGIATYEDSITVYPIPVVDFGVLFNDSCSPAHVSFANTTTGMPQYYSWYINNNFVSIDSNLAPQVFVTDSLDSTYHVTLICSNFCGIDTLTKDVIIHPNTVVAFFNTDVLYGCKPLNVTFTSYVGPNATIQWNFGDGNFGSGYTISHTYDTAGTFLIWQSVDNYCGYDSISRTITVLPQPNLSFNVLPVNCWNVPASITNTSPGIQGSIWDFGDNSSLDSSTTSPTHLYPSPGFYDITLIGIANLTGCRDTIINSIQILPIPEANFAINNNDGCLPFILQLNSTSVNASYFIWTLGNGDTLNNPVQQYTYTQQGDYSIGLTAIDTNGCKDDTSYSFIHVYPIPVADFNFTQSPLCLLPADILFTNISTGAQSFEWDFGIYGSSNVQDPVLNFTTLGQFNAQLIAISTHQCKDTVTKFIKVYPETVAHFSPQADYYCENQPINFINTSVAANNFYWNFGDGTNSIINSPSHIYSTSGLYTVMLIANNDSVCFDTLISPNSIQIFPSPTSNFSYSMIEVTNVDNSAYYQFNDLSSPVVSWNWNFGDNDTSGEENPTHRFFVNGLIKVDLIVFNQYSCPALSSKTILIDYLGSLFIPNAFSPNGGTDETKYFTPKGTGLKSYTIEVFSPYGERVWYSDRLVDGQPVESWDGKYHDKELPQGAYAWKATAIFHDGKIWSGMKYPFMDKPTTEGTVTIIR